jgi:hypothetical protein
MGDDSAAVVSDSCRVAGQGAAVEAGGGQAQMAQHCRGDVDQRRALGIGPRGKAAAMDEQERALLIGAEAAMLAETGDVLGFRRIADDVAVAGNPVRVDAVVGLQGDRNPGRTAPSAGRARKGMARPPALSDRGASCRK